MLLTTKVELAIFTMKIVIKFTLQLQRWNVCYVTVLTVGIHEGECLVPRGKVTELAESPACAKLMVITFGIRSRQEIHGSHPRPMNHLYNREFQMSNNKHSSNVKARRLKEDKRCAKNLAFSKTNFLNFFIFGFLLGFETRGLE